MKTIIIAASVFLSALLQVEPAHSEIASPGFYVLSDENNHVFFRNPYELDENGMTFTDGKPYFGMHAVIALSATETQAIKLLKETLLARPNTPRGPDSVLGFVSHSISSLNWYLRTEDGLGRVFEPWSRSPSEIKKTSANSVEFTWLDRAGWSVRLNVTFHKRGEGNIDLDQTLTVVKAPTGSYSVIYGSRLNNINNFFDESLPVPLPSTPDILSKIEGTVHYVVEENQWVFRRHLVEIHKNESNRRVFTQPIEEKAQFKVEAPGHMWWGIGQDLDFMLWASGIFGPVIGDLNPLSKTHKPELVSATNYGFQWKSEGSSAPSDRASYEVKMNFRF